MRQEWREWEGQNSGEQRHMEISGRERDGEYKLDITRTFRKESREFKGGGLGVD